MAGTNTRALPPARVLTNRPIATLAPASPSLLRPPPALARPPESPYRAPLSDLTYVPGLTPSATYATTTAPQSPVARPAASAVPGIYPRALDPSQTSPRQQETVLAWEDLVKEVNLKPGETKAYFTFAFTNTTPNEVVVTAVRSSCGCTTAKVPTLPWKLPGGTNAAFDVVVDVRGKSGIVTKTVTIETSAGYRYLTTRVAIPAGATGSMATAERARNLQLALADRQSVLAGECATCHVTPGVGKQGAELYEAVCGVCHEAEHRASMVPNLRALGKPFKAEDWRKTIREGKKDSLMPAFATSEGGPLTDAQIESLVTYLAGAFKTLTPASHAKSLNRSAPVNRPQE